MRRNCDIIGGGLKVMFALAAVVLCAYVGAVAAKCLWMLACFLWGLVVYVFNCLSMMVQMLAVWFIAIGPLAGVIVLPMSLMVILEGIKRK